MTAVNRYTFKLNNTSSATTINIPIGLNYYPVDQSDIVEREFVLSEIDKSINPIIDYEVVKLSPIDFNGNPINTVIYNVIFNSGYNYGDISFTNDDLKFRRNNFKKSHLLLDFYDSPVLTSQNYLYSSTIFSRVNDTMFNIGGTIKDVNTIPIRYRLDNPITTPNGVSEGYYLYNYRDEIPKEIFMRATFNNAKTGISTRLTVNNTSQSIDELVGNLHTKYILVGGDNYYYQIDDSYGNVSNIINGGIRESIINLYEINLI
jgi:hypothetical protein